MSIFCFRKEEQNKKKKDGRYNIQAQSVYILRILFTKPQREKGRKQVAITLHKGLMSRKRKKV